jgi:hypothetical protein
LLQSDFVVGDHETHALVLSERFAEHGAFTGTPTAIDCAREAAPSQRMQCVSRAGANRNCA